MRRNNQMTIMPSQTSYPSYLHSPFKPSSSQTNFYSTQGTPKATIIMNPFNQIYHSRNVPANIQVQHRTPQKTHQMPLQTQSESKFIKSYNSSLIKDRQETNTRWTNLLDDDKYLANLEAKMRVLLQENDKLLGLIDEKTKELKEYQEIERKIHVIIAENNRLNGILAEKEKENSGALVIHQNQIIDKQNEQIENLVKNLEEVRVLDEENQNLKGKNQEFLLENQGLIGKLAEKDRSLQNAQEELLEKNSKIKNYESNLQLLLEENSRFRSFFEEKQDENRKKQSILLETNDHLNTVIETLLNENQRLSSEKSTEIQLKDDFSNR